MVIVLVRLIKLAEFHQVQVNLFYVSVVCCYLFMFHLLLWCYWLPPTVGLIITLSIRWWWSWCPGFVITSLKVISFMFDFLLVLANKNVTLALCLTNLIIDYFSGWLPFNLCRLWSVVTSTGISLLLTRNKKSVIGLFSCIKRCWYGSLEELVEKKKSIYWVQCFMSR